MKHNQNQGRGNFQQGRQQKNDKFFKRSSDNNKFKPWKKDQRDDQKFQRGGFKKNFNQNQNKPNQNKPAFNPRKPDDRGGYRQYQNRDGSDGKSFQNEKRFDNNKGDNRGSDSRNWKTDRMPFNKNFKQRDGANTDRKPFNKNFQQRDGANTDRKPFNKNFQQRDGANTDRKPFNKNFKPRDGAKPYNKPQFSNNGERKGGFTRNNQQQNRNQPQKTEEDMGLEEAPKIHYCLAPEVLESRLVEAKAFEPKAQKVDKREEYLKQKQRRNDILKQKTRKGQPVMGPRMELLFEKVQKVVAKEKEAM